MIIFCPSAAAIEPESSIIMKRMGIEWHPLITKSCNPFGQQLVVRNWRALSSLGEGSETWPCGELQLAGTHE